MSGREIGLSRDDEAEVAVTALTAPLTRDRYKGYLRQPIPNDRDDDVRRLVQTYLQADPGLRAAILEQMVGRLLSVLGAFAERQAVEAVRTGSVQPVKLGLAALGMALVRADTREAQLSLSKLDHSARLLGTDLADVFEDVVASLPEPARDNIHQFLSRDDRGPSLLRRMAFVAEGTGDDFVYKSASPYDDDEKH